MSMYFGDVSLCYTNSLAMALDSFGFDVRPERLEALMVMGNGASIMKDDPRHPIVFFDNGEPDVSISNCLRMLGVAWEDFFVEGPTTDLTEVRDRLARMLESGPVVAGPLDMGLLTYNPNFHGLGGVDHFVCVLGLDGGRVHLHDPAGFPYMSMEFQDFAKAWEARAISYRRGSFSMWGAFTRVREPTQEEVYREVSSIMRKRYEAGEAGVIRSYAEAIRRNGMSQQQQAIHQYFSFRLAAARNIYAARFLAEHDAERAQIKERIASLFGQAHLHNLTEDNEALALTLEGIAELDDRFRELCILSGGDRGKPRGAAPPRKASNPIRKGS